VAKGKGRREEEGEKQPGMAGLEGLLLSVQSTLTPIFLLEKLSLRKEKEARCNRAYLQSCLFGRQRQENLF
jgi:hypothetical protein